MKFAWKVIKNLLDTDPRGRKEAKKHSNVKLQVYHTYLTLRPTIYSFIACIPSLVGSCLSPSPLDYLYK